MQKVRWNEIIGRFPDTHVLQTEQWGRLKSSYGWLPHYLVWDRKDDHLVMHYSQEGSFPDITPGAAALVLERRVLPGISVMYAPKGPLLEDWADSRDLAQVLDDLQQFARGFGVIQLKMDPDLILGWGVPGEEGEKTNPVGNQVMKSLASRGWRFSAEQIQYRNTVIIDLQEEEDAILSRMKSKTRYNIRLAGRKGVSVRKGEPSDFSLLYRMYAATAVRGGFTIRGEDYYRTAWELFQDPELNPDDDPAAQALIAEFQEQPIAGAVIYRFKNKAWYLHGMSTMEHSEKMAPHLVQWEAMRWAKAAGCGEYDMWGAPDQFDRTDPLWGVYRFKRGFGGQVQRTLGAWDFPARPFLYQLYNYFIPRMLAVMRWFGDRRTGQQAAEVRSGSER